MLDILYMILPPLAIAVFALMLAYFSGLQSLGVALKTHSPSVLARYGSGATHFARTYAVLSALRADPELRALTHPEVLASARIVYRRLVVALACMMVLLVVGLTISLAKA